MTLTEVRDAVNAKLTGLWNFAEAHQVAYAAVHGRYWQGRITGASLRNHLPTDVTLIEDPKLPDEQQYDGEGNPIYPAVIGIAGSHELGWSGFIPEIWVTLPCAFVADEWLSTAGIGWSLTAYVKYNGTVYARKRIKYEDGSLETGTWGVSEAP